MNSSAPVDTAWDVRGRLLAAAIAALIWAWPGVLHAQAGSAAVADTVVTDCSSDTQLRATVNVAGPSTVTFNCGPGNHTIPVIGAAMQAPGMVTVDGGGRITLDGGDLTGIFQVFASGDLTLRNLTVANGAYNGNYPLENIGRLTLDNVTVRSSRSTATGGAVYNIGTLTVENSRFVDNEGSAGTASGTSGAAIYSEGGVVTVEDSVFSGNRSTSASGGGGAIAVTAGDLSVARSLFSDNQAAGGGALLVKGGTTVTVTYSTFSGNEATTGKGGAVSCEDGAIGVSHSTISGNTAKTFGGGLYSQCDANLTNSTLSGNNGQGGGGGVYQMTSGTATVVAVTIAQNSAPFGAGVYNDGGGSSSLTLRATLLAGNTTGNCDGVITSLGYNLADDNNCSALSQTGDEQNVTLPLGPLANNGGPTATHFPLSGNPARDAIPAAQCGVGDDQRGVARPKGMGCEVGAVEVSYTLWLPYVRK